MLKTILKISGSSLIHLAAPLGYGWRFWSCFKCGNDVACRSFGNMCECSFYRLHGRFCKSLTQMQILRFLENSLQHPQTGFLWPLLDILVVQALCRELIPNKKFPFSKIWLLSAQLEIKLLNLKGARAILGEAIGRAPKDKIELQLGNKDRCRKLYEKYLEWSPENCYAWSKYAELEKSLAQTEHVRALFELAIEQPLFDMPELLWKAYIDFEISEEEFDNTRELYEKLLNRTKHVKVWISYAKFEASAMEESDDDPENRKKCLERARGIKQELMCMEEAEITWGKLFEDENAFKVLQGMSKELRFFGKGMPCLARHTQPLVYIL